jgi:hypothetical protein
VEDISMLDGGFRFDGSFGAMENEQRERKKKTKERAFPYYY